MDFKKGYIYHIYNQGNDGCKIFFDHKNYLYFLRKIKHHLHPYIDIFAWCLMPNHFHIMGIVNFLDVPINDAKPGTDSRSPEPRGGRTSRSINESISILLRSYTRAINKQMKRSGSLFRAHTKAECINCPDGVTPSFFIENNITRINIRIPEEQYPQVCFNYIHQNPVKAGLVGKPTEWEFSSARDFAGLRNGQLINRTKASEYVNIKVE